MSARAHSQPDDGGQQPQKILRIGVIQAGKIVEERLIRRRESVTIGASPRNTIVVPASTLPRTYTLFELQGDTYNLVISETMDGRVSVGQEVMAMEQIRRSRHASPKPGKGNLYRLELNERSRGKVLLGEVTLLFQFVAPPPVQPRPQLPPSVRGGFVNQVDWVLASSFIAMAVVNLSALVYLRNLDIPRKAAVEALPEGFAEFLPTVEKPEPIDVADLAKDVGEEKVEKVTKKPVKRQRSRSKRDKSEAKAERCDADCQAKRAAERRARLAKAVESMGALKMLGTEGEGQGVASDLIGEGDPGRKLDDALSGVSGLRAGGGGSGGLRAKGGGGAGTAAGIGDLGSRVGGPGKVGTGGMVAEKVPKYKFTRAAPKVDGTLNRSSLNRELRRVARGVQRCYERGLKRNPGLDGKLTVRFEINTVGRVTYLDIEVDTIQDPTVSSCVKSTIKRQRFTPPDDGAAEVVVPYLFKAGG